MAKTKTGAYRGTLKLLRGRAYGNEADVPAGGAKVYVGAVIEPDNPEDAWDIFSISIIQNGDADYDGQIYITERTYSGANNPSPKILSGTLEEAKLTDGILFLNNHEGSDTNNLPHEVEYNLKDFGDMPIKVSQYLSDAYDRLYALCKIDDKSAGGLRHECKVVIRYRERKIA